MKQISIIAISGSLKQTSSNTSILRALGECMPAHVAYSIYEGIGSFPFFRPEIEDGTKEVNELRALLKQADGVVFSTPEYAFGVPGVLKNALDWLVSSGELNEKPVVAISASPLPSGGDKAMHSLLLTLKALGTEMTAQSTLMIPAVSLKLEEGVLVDEPTREALRLLLTQLLQAINQKHARNITS